VWWKRLFGAVLGINTTKAYLADKYDYERERVEPMHTDAFAEQVALRLLHIRDCVIDDADDEEFMSKLRSKKQRVSSEVTNIEERKPKNTQLCVVETIHTHELYQKLHEKNPKILMRCRCRCVICHQKTSFYCSTCSTSSHIVSLCGMNSKRCCISTHMSKTMHEHEK
jgi:hypothetical protein